MTALAPTVDELDAVAVLARAEATLEARRLAQVEDLQLVLRWADLHGDDPQARSGAVPARYGGDQLIDLGGDGTPRVQDLCLAELATARQAHVLATRSTMADALDLRHRLPRLWLAVQELACEPWLACRVASMSRGLSRDRIALVDQAVTDAVGCAPGRVLRIAEAKTVEADQAAHAERLEAARRRRGVMLTPSDDAGMRILVARLAAGDAVWIDATVDRVADLLATDADLRRAHHPDLPDEVSKDELRAVALGWLARPHDLAALLGVLDQPCDADVPRRPSAVVHVHLSRVALASGVGVARVEELGPMVLDEVRGLLGHAHITLRPVLDLAATVAVDRYEHPTAVRDRTQLLIPADAFPHATTLSRTRDHDHPAPYDADGPPGQTGDLNCAPLTRRHHRAKTHLGYQVTQVSRTAFVWRTPHGLLRRVDHTGTHRIDETEAHQLTRPDWLDRALAGIDA
ncbi:hypothetical protein [Nocardioides sp. W7]|uniref:hypothetical protein n=1 Tax=Nocardioides sp. W7 TaxID=2931390 RepID=UPI001FD23A99|nr:hypothetical protein [Nocardioides sp. W7]